MSRHADVEATARDAAQAVLSERQEVLSALRLEAKVEISRWLDGDRENAEIRISFWRGPAFVDVVEDFVIRDGQPTASPQELREWLEESIDEVLEASRSGLSREA